MAWSAMFEASRHVLYECLYIMNMRVAMIYIYIYIQDMSLADIYIYIYIHIRELTTSVRDQESDWPV